MEHTVTDVRVGKLHLEGGVSGEGEPDSSAASRRMFFAITGGVGASWGCTEFRPERLVPFRLAMMALAYERTLKLELNQNR